MIPPEHTLQQVAAESLGYLHFEIIGGGFGGGIYRDAELGDPVAQALRDAINNYTKGFFDAPPGSTACFLCSEPLEPPDRAVAFVVVVHPAVPEPTFVCCSPVCTQCWAELPEFNDLQHAIMQRYRTWFPDLTVQHVAEPGHA